MDGTAVQSRVNELERRLAQQQAQIQNLQERLKHAVEITRDKQDEFATVAQAEGVSLNVARRLVAGCNRVGGCPERADVGTGYRGCRQTRRPVARGTQRGDPTQDYLTDRRRDFFPPSRF